MRRTRTPSGTWRRTAPPRGASVSRSWSGRCGARRSQEEAGAATTGLRRGDVDGILSPRFLSLNIPGFILDIAPKGTFPTMFPATFFAALGVLNDTAATDRELGRE